MIKIEFAGRLQVLLNATLDDGPGPRAVVGIVTDKLFNFICNEAGAMTPGAIEEVIQSLRHKLAAVEAEN
jgi:hypothetical protein